MLLDKSAPALRAMEPVFPGLVLLPRTPHSFWQRVPRRSPQLNCRHMNLWRRAASLCTLFFLGRGLLGGAAIGHAGHHIYGKPWRRPPESADLGGRRSGYTSGNCNSPTPTQAASPPLTTRYCTASCFPVPETCTASSDQPVVSLPVSRVAERPAGRVTMTGREDLAARPRAIESAATTRAQIAPVARMKLSFASGGKPCQGEAFKASMTMNVPMRPTAITPVPRVVTSVPDLIVSVDLSPSTDFFIDSAAPISRFRSSARRLRSRHHTKAVTGPESCRLIFFGSVPFYLR